MSESDVAPASQASFIDDLFGDITRGYCTPPPDSIMGSDNGTFQTYQTAQSVNLNDPDEQNPFDFFAVPYDSYALDTVFPCNDLHPSLRVLDWDDLTPSTLPPFPFALFGNPEPDDLPTGAEVGGEQLSLTMDQLAISDAPPVSDTADTADAAGFAMDLSSSSSDINYGKIELRLIQLERAVVGMDGTMLNLKDAMANTIAVPRQDSLPPASVPPTGPAVRRRAPKKNTFSRLVREELKRLLGPDMFDQGNLMSRDELQAFEATWKQSGGQAVCCDIPTFKVDFVGKPHSAWNRSAAHVFSSHFLQKFGACYTRSAVQKAFYTRMRSLQTSYRKSLTSQMVINQEATRRKRRERMRLLYLKRMQLAQKHPYLKHHIPMLQRLGTEGMSSDESDLEENPPKYYVHVPGWRAPEVTSWLHTIDQLDFHFRKMAGRSKGALPRLRIHLPDGPISDKRFVRGLPRCAYRQTWLSGLVNAEHDALLTEESYSFTHDSRLFSYFLNQQAHGGPQI